eukprot:gb/GEZN01005263.1/.p1 GENE.gb/GEZN01005263.1/~~gb/GEZN01005263.1/.p1  ORF type:complete len:518 (-),score=77.87 gb/GEZN01005263.1/:255-1808(-)
MALARPLLVLGYGSVGKSALAIAKEWGKGAFLKKLGASSVTVMSEEFTPADRQQLKQWGCNVVEAKLTAQNHKSTLEPYFSGKALGSQGPAVVLNLTTGVNSLDIMKVGQTTGALVIDSSASEMWPEQEDETVAENFGEIGSNYWCRENMLEYARSLPQDAPTALTCMGANPGLVTLFAKRLLDLIWREKRPGQPFPTNQSTKGTRKRLREQKDWAGMAQELGVKVVHVAERDTQVPVKPRPAKHFTNTWSIDGFILEGVKQCADIGWGTHERTLPPNGHPFSFGCKAAIRLAEPSASVKTLSFVPTFGEQVAMCIAHHEISSIADLLTKANQHGEVQYRPTVLFAYRPSEDGMNSIQEIFEHGDTEWHEKKHVYLPEEIQDGGCDELGILMCTNAEESGTYWYGSTVYSDEARRLAPYNISTTQQVAAGMLSGALWMTRNPRKGLCEPEDIEEYDQVLKDATPFLGKLHLCRSSWTPRGGLPEDDLTWQFQNLRVTESGYNAAKPRIHWWSKKGSW